MSLNSSKRNSKKNNNNANTKMKNKQKSDVPPNKTIKIFNLHSALQFDDLQIMIENIIPKVNIQHIIWPAPDSTPKTYTAWVCLNNIANATKVIEKLDKTTI